MRMAIGILLLTLAVGCGSDKINGPGNESVVGSYALKTMNGATLPTVVIQTPDDKLEVITGTLDLHTDGSYLLVFDLRETQGTAVTDDQSIESGTYSRSNTAVSFHPSDNSGVWSASYASGGILTVTEAGVTFVFRR
ncbi:MAG: hypothetical protein ACJ796_14940 [Gemmatimonadaceae bacterium]